VWGKKRAGEKGPRVGGERPKKSPEPQTKGNTKKVGCLRAAEKPERNGSNKKLKDPTAEVKGVGVSFRKAEP